MAVRYKNTSLKSTNVRIKFDFKALLSRLFFTAAWAISERLTKQIIKLLFFKPVSYPNSDAQEKILSRAQTFTFQSQGNTLAAYKWGEGPAVLFVHGWAGRGAQVCSYVPKLVSKGYSVLAFDHVAHGRSQGSAANYFLFSNAVYDFLDQMADTDVCAIVAHSLGASAAINYLWRTKKKTVTIFMAPALYLIEMLDQTFDQYGVPDYIFKIMLDEIGKQTGHSLALENPKDLLKFLSHEIMIVHDTGDKAVAYEDSWNAGILHNNISLVPTKGLGHIRILEDEAIVDLVVNKIENSAPVADDNASDYDDSGNDLPKVEALL